MADQQPGEVIIPIERNESMQPAQAVTSVSSTVTGTTETPPTSAQNAANQPELPQPFVGAASVSPSPTTQEPPTKTSAAPSPSVSDSYGVTEDVSERDEGITWRSAEFMAHDKDTAWYAATALGSVVIAVIVYILNRDLVTAAIILFALIGLAYFSGRKPREQDFAVVYEGIQVGNNFYPFSDFRSFSLSEDPSATSIILTPMKRFMPAVNIYVPTDYEERVVGFIAEILPLEQHKPDLVEVLMRRIRF